MTDLHRHDLWIMDILVRYRVPVRYFTLPATDLQSQWNRVPIRETESEVVNRLKALICTGLISWKELLYEGSHAGNGISMNSITSGLEEYDFIRGVVELTRKGGHAWEEWAEPDWNRFFDTMYEYEECSLSDEREGGGVIIFRCGSRTRLRELLLNWPKYWREQLLNPSETVANEESPFEATYWKALHLGVTATVRFEIVVDNSAQGSVGDLWKWTKRGFGDEAFDLWDPGVNS